MIINQILIAASAFILMLFVANILIPNFRREKRYGEMATSMMKSEAELKRLRQGGVQKYLAYKLIPNVQKKVKTNVVFTKNLRTMHELLDDKRTFEEMLAAKMVRAMFVSIPTLFLPIITGEFFFIAAYPACVVFMFINDVRGIRLRFSRMQREITKDLPLLIDKMMIALETGKPFIGVFADLEKNTAGRMNFLLKRLNGNMQNMKPEDAISLFAKETTIPVMMQFATAVKIGINNSYEEAKEDFDGIKEEILELRRISLEQITSNKPKKVSVLYALLIGCAVVAVGISLVEVVKQINTF